MTLRKAHPQEAEILWNIRNQAIRHGCKTSYDADVIARWTPDDMPEHYRQMVAENPFYVVEDEKGDIAATGYLDLETHYIEAVFTLPAASGKGLATQIIEALKRGPHSRDNTFNALFDAKRACVLSEAGVCDDGRKLSLLADGRCAITLF